MRPVDLLGQWHRFLAHQSTSVEKTLMTITVASRGSPPDVASRMLLCVCVCVSACARAWARAKHLSRRFDVSVIQCGKEIVQLIHHWCDVYCRTKSNSVVPEKLVSFRLLDSDCFGTAAEDGWTANTRYKVTLTGSTFVSSLRLSLHSSSTEYSSPVDKKILTIVSHAHANIVSSIFIE